MVLDQCGLARITEAGGEALHEPHRPIRGAHEQRASRGRDLAAIKGRFHPAPSTLAEANESWLHRVGVGALLFLSASYCVNASFAESEPLCAYSV